VIITDKKIKSIIKFKDKEIKKAISLRKLIQRYYKGYSLQIKYKNWFQVWNIIQESTLTAKAANKDDNSF